MVMYDEKSVPFGDIGNLVVVAVVVRAMLMEFALVVL